MKIRLLISLLTGLTAARPAVHFTPPAPVPCTMSNGQPRPYPCEFQILKLSILGKNNEVVGEITPGSTSVKLPKSKAVNVTHATNGDSYFYDVSLVFRRMNTPSFSPKPSPIPGLTLAKGFYEVGTSTVNYPISPGEVTIVKTVNVSPGLPGPNVRSNQVRFALQLTYATGNGAGLVAPVRYVQIKNPITFTKFTPSINQYRDRAEAWLAFSPSVDMAN